jgi:5'-3' exonuclease
LKTFGDMTRVEEDQLAIVDSLNLAFRYKHSRAVDFADDYMETVESLKKSYHCDKLVIVGDKGSSTYRKLLHPGYKGARKLKHESQTEAEAEEFLEFLAEVQLIIEKYEAEANYPVFRFQGVEADDIAAYICAKRAKYSLQRIWLISSDRDWNLLVDDFISQFSYVTRKEFTADNWSDHYDFTRDDYISIKCLMGDSGDSVPGVPGVGPKKALQLVQEYGSAFDVAAALPIASKYKYIANLNSFGSENILLNYKLMDLVTYCADAIGQDNCAIIDKVLDGYLGV